MSSLAASELVLNCSIKMGEGNWSMIEPITAAAAAEAAVTTQADADDGLFQKLHKHSNCTKCKFCSYCQRFFKVADVPSNTCNTFVVIFFFVQDK